jgi:predicted ABC-type sugar transport system permease subunit
MYVCRRMGIYKVDLFLFFTIVLNLLSTVFGFILSAIVNDGLNTGIPLLLDKVAVVVFGQILAPPPPPPPIVFLLNTLLNEK